MLPDGGTLGTVVFATPGAGFDKTRPSRSPCPGAYQRRPAGSGTGRASRALPIFAGGNWTCVRPVLGTAAKQLGLCPWQTAGRSRWAGGGRVRLPAHVIVERTVCDIDETVRKIRLHAVAFVPKWPAGARCLDARRAAGGSGRTAHTAWGQGGATRLG